MRISWGEDYAVIFMHTLAKNYNKKLISLSHVSSEHKISIAFLKQLAMLLKKKNLIVSKEGVTGGYKLAKDPSSITLFDVVAAVNKRRELTTCCHDAVDKNKEGKCPREETCQSKNAWQRINQQINNSLKSVTLSQL